MNLNKLEIWVHDHVLKNAKIRHFFYRIYQRVMWLISPKLKYDGDVQKVTPNDNYEYLFGYYDKSPWSPNGELILALRVKNAHKKADSCEKSDIVCINPETKEVDIVASTCCWNVQQGCMLQWVTNDSFVFNDFRNGKYVSVVKNLCSKEETIIDAPVYSLSSKKDIGLTLDFSRLHRLRPGYGYCNIDEVTKKERCPDSPCIWLINYESGTIKPILKYTDFANFEPKESMNNAVHKVNHLMISPNGKRFMVLHRWFLGKTKYTRLVTCNIDGTEMFNLSDDDFVSHCYWKNDDEIVSYLNKKNGGKGYYLLHDKTSSFERIWPELLMDGHPSFSPSGEYAITDTYPDRRRIQSLYLMKNDSIKKIVRVFSPFKYSGDVRCDLHPRWSPNNKMISFDGSFEGKRAVYISKINDSCEAKKHRVSGEKETKISVIIPCYNCGEFIDETLNSLEKQTYKNFTIVCVNDGSTDNTLLKLESWKQKSKMDIIIVNQPNSGVSKARNAGIDRTTTEYLTFCDSDDLYHPEFLESLIYSIKEMNVISSYCILGRNREKVMTSNFIGGPSIKSQEEAMSDLLYRMGDISFCCYCYKTAIIKSNKIYFDENTKFGEDREFNWKYLCHCDKLAFFDQPLYWYRVNQKSATKSNATWKKTDLLSAVKRIEEYLDLNKCVFADEFRSYMYARAMWAVAKTFAISKNKQLFKKLRREYDVKKCMKITKKDKNKLVALASKLYLLNPGLFYFVISKKG